MDSSLKIGTMDALLMVLTLEVVLMQMRILEGSSELRAKHWQITNETQKQQREKLVRDRETVKDVIRRTLIELAESGEWHSLQVAVQVLQNEAERAVSRRLQHDELQASRGAIIEELETKRQQWEEELRNAAIKTALLRDKMNDDQLNANARLAYVEKWLLARAESLDLQYEQPRAPLPRLDHEQRVHEELLKALDMQINELEESVKYWEARYAADTKDIKARLAARTEELRIANARHAELQKLFDLHQGEIRAWLTFKKERAARIAREEHLRLSATRIQAWWRGLMVRRALGQFRYLKNIKKSSSKNKKK